MTFGDDTVTQTPQPSLVSLTTLKRLAARKQRIFRQRLGSSDTLLGFYPSNDGPNGPMKREPDFQLRIEHSASMENRRSPPEPSVALARKWGSSAQSLGGGMPMRAQRFSKDTGNTHYGSFGICG